MLDGRQGVVDRRSSSDVRSREGDRVHGLVADEGAGRTVGIDLDGEGRLEPLRVDLGRLRMLRGGKVGPRTMTPEWLDEDPV
jgi:hypothetical protein